MCGIAGQFALTPDARIDAVLLSRMTACIVHRGPDDQGSYINPGQTAALGHRRLSIIDLTTGHQPMSNESKDIWIVFNGEIYNFKELKAELLAKGIRFHTSSDTEVIIALYQEYGERSFARLNGIFALALFDVRKNCVIIARDHFGVKPLYYTSNNGRLLFASEIKAILQDVSVPKELDYDALHSFLTFRYNPSPQTMLRNIHKLPPGHYLKATPNGDVHVASYWEYSPSTNLTIGETEAVTEYQRLLQSAVHRQMISDVPVGLLLSGGIDSAVIGMLMRDATGERIKTFTIGFEGEGDYNETVDARSSAQMIGSEHYDVVISQKEYLDFFFQSFEYTEEPIAETTIPALYYVSKLASQHLKVVLAGQGADEPLAGYHRYKGEKYISKLAPLLAMLPLNTIARVLPRNERLKRAAYAMQFSEEYKRFLGIYTIFTPAMKQQLLNEETRMRMQDRDAELVQRLYAETGGLESSLSKLLYIDTRMSLSDDLLLFGDKVTMANSLEMRVPFLDVDLVKFLESLPARFKLRGSTGKYIHKKALTKWLPNEVINRKKRGFATPMDQWLQGGLADVARELMNAPGSAARLYFNLGYINQMIDDHRNRRENYQRHIFALLSFELWHKAFLGSQPNHR